MEYRTLTQTQIIQSLGEALAWFEKELGWGVKLGELRHLTGRIGELHAAMITRGQMAPLTNQRGYDVVSAEGEHVSVKTRASLNPIRFNQNTFDLVDRIIVLLIKVEDGEVSIEELIDCSATDALPLFESRNGEYHLNISGTARKVKSRDKQNIISTIKVDQQKIVQYENGAITVEEEGAEIHPTKPLLRKFAARFSVDILNGNGNPKNTRSLGADVIRAVTEIQGAPQ